VSLKKYKSQGKAVEETRRKTLKTFVWISSKNVASVLKEHFLPPLEPTLLHINN
jgi:hypothetical protein